MGVFMNTRRSGTATGHVTAELEALTNEATIGTGNFVFEAGGNFEIAVTPGTGEVAISSGIFSWCGRLGGVDTFDTVKYTPPGSETLYKKVVICAKYSKDSATLVENISLTAIESENQASESAAAGITLVFENENISAVSETAYFPLWEFIASSNSHTEPVQLFKTVNNIKLLFHEIQNIKKSAAEETQNRIAADEEIKSKVALIEKGYVLIEAYITGQKVFNVDIKKYIAFVLYIQTEKDMGKHIPFFIPAKDGNYYMPRYKFEPRSLGGYDVSVNYAVATVDETYGTVSFQNENNEAIGSFVMLYGIK